MCVCTYSVLYISVYKSGSLDEIARQTRDILLKSKTVADDGGFGLHIASPGLQSLSWRLAQIQPQNFQSMLSSFRSSSQKPTPRSKLALLVRNRQSYHKLQCILLPAPTTHQPIPTEPTTSNQSRGASCIIPIPIYISPLSKTHPPSSLSVSGTPSHRNYGEGTLMAD